MFLFFNPPIGAVYLMTWEALCNREIKPKIFTKDEYKSRKLTIKL